VAACWCSLKAALACSSAFLDHGDDALALERFLDEIDRAFFHRIDGHGHVAVAGDEDDGQR